MKRRLMILLLAAACAHSERRPDTLKLPVMPPVAASQMLFPYGHYRHVVRLQPNGPSGPLHSYGFEGLVETNQSRIQVVALSPFQTTLFKLDENRSTGEVQSECYDDSIKKYQPRILSFYALVREILLLPASVDDASGLRRVTLNGGRTQAVLQRYDGKMPREVQINDRRFSVNIKIERLTP